MWRTLYVIGAFILAVPACTAAYQAGLSGSEAMTGTAFGLSMLGLAVLGIAFLVQKLGD